MRWKRKIAFVFDAHSGYPARPAQYFAAEP
jgi:hypothetical protein